MGRMQRSTVFLSIRANTNNSLSKNAPPTKAGHELALCDSLQAQAVTEFSVGDLVWALAHF